MGTDQRGGAGAARETEKVVAGGLPVCRPVRGDDGLSGPVYPGGRGDVLSVLRVRRRPGRGRRGGGAGAGRVRRLLPDRGRAALPPDRPGGGPAGGGVSGAGDRRAGAGGPVQRGGAVRLPLRLPLFLERPERPGPHPPPAGGGGGRAGGGVPGAGPGDRPLPAPGPGDHRRGGSAGGCGVRQPLWHAGGGLCPGLPPGRRPVPAEHLPG